jgi:hypothetical protein
MAVKSDNVTIPLNLSESPGIDPERVDATAKLVNSLNTRFTATRGRLEKAPGVSGIGSTTIVDQNPYCHGIVPDSTDSACAYFRPKFGQKSLHVNANTMAAVQSTVIAGNGQNTYVPLRVTDSAYVHSGASTGAASVVHVDTYRVFATFRNIAGASGIYITVQDNEGAPLYSSRLLSAADYDIADPPFLALTQHNGNGVFLWYGRAGDVTGYALTIDATSVSAGSPIALFVGANISVSSAAVGDDDAYAWIVATSNTLVQPRLYRYNVLTGAVVSRAFAGWSVNSCSISHVALAPTVGGTKASYLLVASSGPGGGLSSYALIDGYDSALAVRWSVSGTHFNGRVATGFYCTGATDAERFALIAIGYREGRAGSAQWPRTVFQVLDFAGVSHFSTLNWMLPADQACTWVANGNGGSDTEVYSIFPMIRNNGTGGGPAGTVLEEGVGAFDFDVDDQALTLVIPRVESDTSKVTISPVARLAINQRPAANAELFVLVGYDSLYGANSPCMHIANGELLYSYAESPAGQALAFLGTWYYPRAVALSLNGGGSSNNGSEYNGIVPSVLTDGPTLIAAAQPAHWDGLETVELGFAYRPFIVGLTPNAAPGLTGTYRFKAVYKYRDRHGELHRSEPSSYVELSPAAPQTCEIRVTVPFTMRDGVRQEDVQIELYVTDGTDQLTYYSIGVELAAPTVINGYWQWADLRVAMLDAPNNGVPLFTDGSALDELPPQAPPALWDAAGVRDRVWAVLAEDRSVVWPSKQRKASAEDIDQNVALEFTPSLAQRFPVAAGKIVAVRDFQGMPIFLCEHGVYTVDVDSGGPDNTGGGSLFPPPRKIAAVGCVDRDSCIVTPAGVMFAATTGNPALFGAGGLRTFSEQRQLDPRGAALILSANECVFLNGYGDTARVYNWDADAWSTWQLEFALSSLATTASGLILAFNGIDTGGLNGFFYLKNDTHSPQLHNTSCQMALKTAWVMPGGIGGDVTFDEVWIRSRYIGAHTLNVTIYRDFTADLSTARQVSWTATELQSLKDGLGNYVVRVPLSWQARSVQIEISESVTFGWGMSPLTATVYYRVDSAAQLRALPDGASK